MSFKVSLEGRTAIVTGAGSGIGRGLATGLAAAGARVVAVDVDASTAETTCRVIASSGGVARAETLDVTDVEQVSGLAERLSGEGWAVDILVNNAGIFPAARPGEPGFLDAWKRTIDVNLTGYAVMAEAFLPHLRAVRGSIVNIGSVHCWTAPPFGVHYSAAKAGVLNFTKSLAGALAPDGVRVNGIAPGIIATPMTAATRSDPEKIAKYLEGVPMGRVGEPEELVGPLLFLVSDAASYVTGIMLPVDGGYLTF
jgi:NAD(P)-dependent dehydrogenase (short-subunit alcohol dehydrogenase family)